MRCALARVVRARLAVLVSTMIWCRAPSELSSAVQALPAISANAISVHVDSLEQCAKHGGCERVHGVNSEMTSITFSHGACRRHDGKLHS